VGVAALEGFGMNGYRRKIRFAVALVAQICLCAARESALAADDDAAADIPEVSRTRQSVIVVVGAAGADEYKTPFAEWAQRWSDAAAKAGAKVTVIGAEADVEDGASNSDDRARLQEALTELAGNGGADANVVWLVLIGHGSFDGQTAKFNLRGPDVSAADLKEWLAPIQAPLAVVNCASASAPFLNEISGPERVVITATKSGHELNFARFGEYLAAAIDDPRADLDKDDQTSLLEAYLTACRDVAEFYAGEQRLATEHALLDDNGDGLGTPAAWFRGIRATQRANDGAALDGLRAHQFHLVPSDREAGMPADVRARRDELELELAALRDRKAELDEDAYYAQLEPLLVELARLYSSLNEPPTEIDDGANEPTDSL
jgi:hypothetical protein